MHQIDTYGDNVSGALGLDSIVDVPLSCKFSVILPPFIGYGISRRSVSRLKFIEQH